MSQIVVIRNYDVKQFKNWNGTQRRKSYKVSCLLNYVIIRNYSEWDKERNIFNNLNKSLSSNKMRIKISRIFLTLIIFLNFISHVTKK